MLTKPPPFCILKPDIPKTVAAETLNLPPRNMQKYTFLVLMSLWQCENQRLIFYF
jgi:hypothetical protein